MKRKAVKHFALRLVFTCDDQSTVKYNTVAIQQTCKPTNLPTSKPEKVMSSVLDRVLNKRKDLESRGSRRKTVTLSKGDNIWRILPSWRSEGDGDFWHDFGQHWVRRPGADKPEAVYVCVDKTFGRPCDICQAISDGIMHAPNDGIVKALKDAQSSQRYLLNVIRREAPSLEVEIGEVPYMVFKQIMDLYVDYIKQGVDITSLDKGIDLNIKREGSGMTDTRYSIIPKALSSAIDKSVLTKLHNLDEYVAQENASGKNKALTAVGGLGGRLLAAPKVDDGLGSLDGEFDHDVPEFAPPATTAAAEAASTAPWTEEPKAVVAPAAPAAPTKPKAPATSMPDEAELEALLADL